MLRQPKPRDKRALWPWRWWMTVGVGVLATSREGRERGLLPDHIILVSDTMGSYGNEFAHPRLHKRFDLPEHKTFILAADQVDRAAELVPMIEARLSQFPPDSRTYGETKQAICEACFFYKMELFKQSVLPRLRVPPEAFDPREATSEFQAVIQQEWELFGIGCDLLIGTFDHKGQAALTVVNGAEGTASSWNFPGFTAIGSGGPNALFWLSHRGHTLGMTPLRALYHAYEAKVMAEDAPNVNDKTDVLVANAENNWSCSSHVSLADKAKVPEFPIDSLETLFDKYKPSDTSELDAMPQRIVKPLAPQKSGDQQ